LRRVQVRRKAYRATQRIRTLPAPKRRPRAGESPRDGRQECPRHAGGIARRSATETHAQPAEGRMAAGSFLKNHLPKFFRPELGCLPGALIGVGGAIVLWTFVPGKIAPVLMSETVARVCRRRDGFAGPGRLGLASNTTSLPNGR